MLLPASLKIKSVIIYTPRQRIFFEDGRSCLYKHLIEQGSGILEDEPQWPARQEEKLDDGQEGFVPDTFPQFEYQQQEDQAAKRQFRFINMSIWLNILVLLSCLMS